MPSDQTPSVTILVCTRDRGESAVVAIRSIFSCTYLDFTLLIVDQSSDTRTEQAIAAFRSDPRLRYVRTSTQGLSTALNIGLALSAAELVLMTDDDCEVPPNWIAEMVAPFLRHPRVGVVFCDVVAAPHDHQAGFIPVSLCPRALLIADLARWQACDGVNIGIGAGMAIRRSAAEAIGGFNPLFGSGSHFRSGNDLDFTLRALIANYQVVRVNHIGVVHHGFRDLQETRSLIRESMFSIGAIYGRLFRRGHWLAARNFIMMARATVGAPIVENLLRLRRPPVIGRVLWLARGLIEGLCLAPDRRSRDNRIGLG